jgi:Uri superfamily endonuclease
MPDAAPELPGDPGAYVLTIALAKHLCLNLSQFAGSTLAPGTYAYCGSAYGPGGIRARVARHLRRDKPLRWHVDRLTAAGRIDLVGIRVGGRECDLVDEILSFGGTVVLHGFGSSDCNRCPTHLLALPDEANLLRLQEILFLTRP